MEKEQGFTMSLELLDKTRKIYRLLNRQESDKVDFNDFCRMLSQEMEVNVLLLSQQDICHKDGSSG